MEQPRAKPGKLEEASAVVLARNESYWDLELAIVERGKCLVSSYRRWK